MATGKIQNATPEERTISELIRRAGLPLGEGGFCNPPFTDPDDIKNVLKGAGYVGFVAKEWQRYILVLASECEARKQGRSRYIQDKIHDPTSELPLYNPVCPFCGGKRERVYYHHGLGFRDGSFGQAYVFSCENDAYPCQHFIFYGMYLLAKKRGMSVSLESMKEVANDKKTESPQPETSQ